MSAIDSFKHDKLFTFCGISAYRLLQDAPANDLVLQVAHNKIFQSPDYMLGPQHILIGGGSGEHPALAVRINEAVEQFLGLFDGNEKIKPFLLSFDRPELGENSQFQNLIHEMSEHLDESPEYFNSRGEYLLDLNQWPIPSWFVVDLKLKEQIWGEGHYRSSNNSRYCVSRIQSNFYHELEKEGAAALVLAVIGANIAYNLVSSTESKWGFSQIVHPKMMLALELLGKDILELLLPDVFKVAQNKWQ